MLRAALPQDAPDLLEVANGIGDMVEVLEPMVIAAETASLGDAIFQNQVAWVEACRRTTWANLSGRAEHADFLRRTADGWLLADSMLKIAWELTITIPESHYDDAKRVATKARKAAAFHGKALEHLVAAECLLGQARDELADTPILAHRLPSDVGDLAERVATVRDRLGDLERSAHRAGRKTKHGRPRARSTDSAVALDQLLAREGLDPSPRCAFVAAYLQLFFKQADATPEKVRQLLKDFERRRERERR